MEGFIFGGKGLPGTPQELARKRELVQAIMARNAAKTPRNMWEGLNSVADAIGTRVENDRFDKAEAEGRAGATGKFDDLVKALSGSSSPAAATPASYSPGLDGVKSALLNTIAGPESAGNYDVMYGGGRFKDFSDHPRQAIPITSGPNAGNTSSAAGKYQFLGSTWDEQKAKLKLPDFGPESQDAAAWDLAATNYNKQTGGNLADALSSGNPDSLKQVADALKGTWTSMPGGIEQGIDGNSFASTFQKNLGANVQPAGGQQQPVQVAQNGGLDPALLGAMSDPWMNEGQQSVIKALLEQQLQSTDPKNKLEARKLQAEINALENPKPKYGFEKMDDGTLVRTNEAGGTAEPILKGAMKPTNDLQEYNFYVDQAKAAGQTPLPFDQYQIALRRSGATQINTGPNGEQFGSPGSGLVWQRAPDGSIKLDERGAPVAIPFQGGAAYKEQVEGANQAEVKKTNVETAGNIVVQDIDRALKTMDSATLPTTGLIGGGLSNVPGTASRDIRGLVDTVKSNVGFDKLQRMREASPTGGALGQVSERELDLLNATIGNLEQSQSEEQFRDNLRRVKNVYLDIIHGPGSGPAREQLQFEQREQNAAPGQPDAEGWVTMPNGIRIREKK